MSIQRALTKNKAKKALPYHNTPLKELSDVDSGLRIQFCNWILVQERISNILLTDESTFTRTDAVNFHNKHTWSMGNPHTRIPPDYTIPASIFR